MHRRGFLLLAKAPERPLSVRVNVLFDQGAHAGQGLSLKERAKFAHWQDLARREFAVSGIQFDVRTTEGAFLRTQKYSEVPEQFLATDRLNVFVTETLRLDVDRQRTGGASVGPWPSSPGRAGSRFYKTFIGVREAGEATLVHEYGHHFALDTAAPPTLTANLLADLRNDYWLWRQRHGVAIAGFRECARSPWVGRG